MAIVGAIVKYDGDSVFSFALLRVTPVVPTGVKGGVLIYIPSALNSHLHSA